MAEDSPLEEEVRNIVNEDDPIKLLAAGCPSDEYDSEVQKILSVLREEPNPNQLHDKIYTIFIKSFDETITGPKENYRQLSRNIYSLI